MKRVLTWGILALLLAVSLPSCGCGDIEADLVFVNGSETAVTAVLADFADQDSVVQNADSSPLKRGESFGFEAGEYPVTIIVYDRPFEGFGQEKSGQLTIKQAPPDGERWYITARDNETGLMLTALHPLAGGGVRMDAQTELELLNRFSVVLPWILWRLPLAAMLVIWAVCVVRRPGNRRVLLALFAAAAALAAVLFGGRRLLEQNGLTYRTWLLEGLSIALWAAGLALGIFTVRRFHDWLKKTHPKLAAWGMALGLYCLVCVMLSGTVLGGLWAMGPGEEVGFYHGRRVVQGRWTWMEASYNLYEYHGPLVRGINSIAWGEGSLLGS